VRDLTNMTRLALRAIHIDVIPRVRVLRRVYIFLRARAPMFSALLRYRYVYGYVRKRQQQSIIAHVLVDQIVR